MQREAGGRGGGRLRELVRVPRSVEYKRGGKGYESTQLKGRHPIRKKTVGALAETVRYQGGKKAENER